MADAPVARTARRKLSASAVPKPRRTQAMRSGEMKRRILDAAFEVLKERGFAGFTTLEVARRAGVSRGAQVHHFPSKQDLVTAAMEHVFGIALADGLRLAEAAKRSGRPVEALIGDAQAFYFGDYFFVGLDMLLAGGKDPTLKEAGIRVVRNYRRPVEQQWLAVIQELGLPARTSEDLLLLTVSLVRGFGIRQLWSAEPERVAGLLAMWQDMIATYVAAKVPTKGAAARIATPARRRT
ncbi:TetR/AcrR family transcriptional regulator [Caenimonas sedimenti]|uniref:TetR/AcrR family transcriptional regulator n=1 Tax=Caenimonas sedimenti TaxID=2596921 RepID=A0A562ZRM5_9BURK|nr:TetR/AcrR family transcriptional regulator [Caenimonas sedimenti]TWO71260.1 TetR/AcrR family transcriptional regulator [Caenimonas sedimenti]